MNSKYYKNVLKKRIGYLVLLVCVIAIGAILSSVSPYIFGKNDRYYFNKKSKRFSYLDNGIHSCFVNDTAIFNC